MLMSLLLPELDCRNNKICNSPHVCFWKLSQFASRKNLNICSLSDYHHVTHGNVRCCLHIELFNRFRSALNQLANMKLLIFLTFFVFFTVVNGLSFSERKSQLIKVLQTDVAHRSSCSYRRRRYRSHSSSSEESREVKKRLLQALYARSNPRSYADYPGMYL